jgi:uncharacterized membrane protein
MLMPRWCSKVASLMVASVLVLPAAQAALSQPNAARPNTATAARPAIVDTPAVPSDNDLANTREQLLALLRMTPTLTQVLETDPTLLANQEYLSSSNPQLAQFLAQHPEVARNPDFYLFANFRTPSGRFVNGLHRRIGGGNDQRNDDADSRRRFLLNLSQVPALLAVFAMFIWLIRILLENRRWARVFRMQSEVHSKLLDRFANSDELLQYINTEPGKRFLEAAPIPIEFAREQRLPGGLARVLGPLQIGVVLTLLGVGLLLLHRSRSLEEISPALLVFGMVTIMPGIGFIISALISWRISAHLGLLPQRDSSSTELTDRQ